MDKDNNNSNYTITKASHHINTTADEYLPVLDKKNKRIYFTGMDRTGFFDFKIDFTKVKNSGGEDIFYSEINNGILSDAKPLTFLNTNSHESVTDVMENGDLIITGNYAENIGPSSDNDNGAATTDIFLAKKKGNDYHILHLPEPVNSIFNEFDGVSGNGLNYLLFSSDRSGNIGDYHKKGWLWENNKWGNTDIYVTIKNGNEWGIPINLGNKLNTPKAERSPWLSKDGLIIYLSSNGYESKDDLDIYYFKRENKEDWTNWEGPFKLKDKSTNNDDWGYKIYDNEISYYSSTEAFKYQVTQKTRSGDGGIRETNYRSGYKVNGAQSASLKKEYNSDIFISTPKKIPQINISDFLFQFNKSDLKPEFITLAENITDYCALNSQLSIEIIGHTDNVGDDDYNINLSMQRAKSVQLKLEELGVKNKIEIKGYGSKNPLLPNNNEENRKKNRRVEIYFK